MVGWVTHTPKTRVLVQFATRIQETFVFKRCYVSMLKRHKLCLYLSKDIVTYLECYLEWHPCYPQCNLTPTWGSLSGKKSLHNFFSHKPVNTCVKLWSPLWVPLMNSKRHWGLQLIIMMKAKKILWILWPGAISKAQEIYFLIKVNYVTTYPYKLGIVVLWRCHSNHTRQ